MQYIDIIEEIKNTRVLVVGDVMLDQFVYGDAERISPESPVPVLRIKDKKEMLGGAGNVASNLAGLQADCKFISVVGDDENGSKIRNIIQSLGFDDSGLVTDASRPTTVKTRYIAQGQQLLRTDSEKTDSISDDVAKKLQDKVATMIKDVQAVIISDYNKGVLCRELIAAVIAQAGQHDIPVLVDPKRDDFSIYAGADIVTPNKKELSDSVEGMSVDNDEHVTEAARALIEKSDIKIIIATRSNEGMSIVQADQEPIHMKANVREVYDVSGAGDTVIAVLAAAMGAGAQLKVAATMANMAGGIVVGKTGTSPIMIDDFAAQMWPKNQAPVLDWEDAREQIESWQAQGLSVGFTNGCFDIVHYGHVNYLNEAKQKCDRLILGLNSDQSVKILKGANRPINDEKARATVMGAMGSIDMVVLFGAENDDQDNTPCAVVDALRPDKFFKGGDYTIDQLPEAKVVQGYGGEVDIMPVYEGYSTTSIINKSKQDKAA
ncbi:MAG: D-glycero-beta-D-manno-heptose-7-phosphate kinase [Pseudomonadota bacterium]